MVELEATFDGQKIGTVSWAGRFTFSYDRSWSSFPLSVTLPLGGPTNDEAAHAFFANLLPEGGLRHLICRRLGLSEDNDFGLLSAIGGDCAGALSLRPRGVAEAAADYRPLDEKELAKAAIGSPSVLAVFTGVKGFRLSLAGAQDKLPVRIDGEKLFLPVGSAASTHILKFANRDFAHLPANEAFMALLARELGLEAAPIELRRVGKQPVAVVTRYDRIVKDGKVSRLHQEDLCQALGRDPRRKYEKEGGPSVPECVNLIAAHSADPLVDIKAVLDWQVFNVIAGNCDGHGKNLSLLYEPTGIRLAPRYDLVCTRAYHSLDRDLAMSVAGLFDPTNVLRRHWEACAVAAGVKPALVIGSVERMAMSMPAASTAAAKRFRAQWGDSPVLQQILPVVRKQARRCLKQLKG